MLPDVSTTSMISRLDVGTRCTVWSTGSPSSVTSKADGRVAGAAQAGGAVTTAVTAG